MKIRFNTDSTLAKFIALLLIALLFGSIAISYVYNKTSEKLVLDNMITSSDDLSYFRYAKGVVTKYQLLLGIKDKRTFNVAKDELLDYMDTDMYSSYFDVVTEDSAFSSNITVSIENIKGEYKYRSNDLIFKLDLVIKDNQNVDNVSYLVRVIDGKIYSANRI